MLKLIIIYDIIRLLLSESYRNIIVGNKIRLSLY